MAKNRSARRRVQGPPEPPCEKRWDKVPCRPINRYWVLGPDGRLGDIRFTCACGKRFKPASLGATHARRLLALVGEIDEPGLTNPIDPAQLWTEDLTTELGKVGVVPVGTPVLHSPTRWYLGPADGMRPLADRMARTMRKANGVGLAANQVGADTRALIHDLAELAPPFLINPRRVAVGGSVSRSEGCLSLNVPGSYGEVLRWRQVTVAAMLLDGRRIVIEADEMLARVLQHELDHLDGIEYVQRMSGEVRESIYATLVAARVETKWLPPIGPEVEAADHSSSAV